MAQGLELKISSVEYFPKISEKLNTPSMSFLLISFTLDYIELLFLEKKKVGFLYQLRNMFVDYMLDFRLEIVEKVISFNSNANCC